MKLLRVAGSLCLGLFVLVSAVYAQTVERVDIGGGVISSPVVRGEYLYVGTGATVSVWNMSNPSIPVYAGRTNQSPTHGPVSAVAIVGEYLYAAWHSLDGTGGITIYSLADPERPSVVGEFDDYVSSEFKSPEGLATSGSYVYVGDSQNGLFVLNASDPLNPIPVGTVAGFWSFSSMSVFGSQLLTSGTNFIADREVGVIDITDPSAPMLAGSVILNGSLVDRAVLTDGYAIGVGNDLLVYDLHDPAHITQVFATSIDPAQGAIRNGNTLYLVGGSGIQVWDFTMPIAPTLLRSVAMPTSAPDQTALTPFGPLILTHLDRGVLLDLADPQQPTLAAEFTLPIGVATRAGAVVGGYAYFAEKDYGLGVADAATLAPIGRYDADLSASPLAPNINDIAIDSGRAYLAARGYGVLIVDLADPVHPIELGRFPLLYASAIEANGNRVYVSSYAGDFKILDVSDAAVPQELGSLTTSLVYDVTVRGDYAYLAEGSAADVGGMRVVDISNSMTPTLVGEDTGCTEAAGIDVSADGNLTYVACVTDGTLRIVDTMDKSNPALLGSVALPGVPGLPDYNVAHSVAVVGNVAYVGDEYGLDEVDVSNPAKPVQTLRHDFGYFVSKVERAADGRILAFTQAAGVFVFAPQSTDAIFANGFD
jgi:hypothetical protein